MQAESLAQQFRSYTYVYRSCSSRSYSVKDNVFLEQRDIIVNESLRLILDFIFKPYFVKWKEELKHSHILSSCCYSMQEILPDFCYQMRTRLTSNSLGLGGEFDSLDPAICLVILRRYIKDQKFLALVNDFLLVTPLQKKLDSTIFTTLSRKDSLLCLLYDIYYFEFDKFIVRTFGRLESKINTSPILSDPYKFSTLWILHNLYSIRWYNSGKAKNDELKYFKPLQKVDVFCTQQVPRSSTFIYYRYRTSWVVLLSSGNSINLKQTTLTVSEYIQTQLRPRFLKKVCHDINLTNGFLFLGYAIKVSTGPTKRLRVSSNSFSVSHAILTPDRQQILHYLFLQSFITKKNFFPIAKRGWVTFSDYEIICNFRKTFLEITYYYKYSDSLKFLSFVHYLLKLSCAKTLAYKNRISLTQVFTQYGLTLTTEKRIYLRQYYKISSISFPSLLDFKKA